MDYIEISFNIPNKDAYSDIVVAKLNEIEFDSYLDHKEGIQAYIQEDLLHHPSLDRVIHDLKNLFKFDFSIRRIKEVNWNKEWEENFNPIEINKDCIVRSEFHNVLPQYKYNIIINPKMSFGTGHHETTFLMMNEVFSLDIHNKDVLDIGCGTGVLSILAKYLGSRTTIGIDVDEWSFKNSIENAKLNNIDSIEFRLGDIKKVSEKFDIILANINRNVIFSEIKNYILRLNDEGSLLLSGFLSKDVNLIKKCLDDLELRFVSIKNKNKWNLLHFVK